MTDQLTVEWPHRFAPDSGCGKVLKVLQRAGSRGITGPELVRWGVENYCQAAMRRLQELRQLHGVDIPVRREPPLAGKTRYTYRYWLAQNAPKEVQND